MPNPTPRHPVRRLTKTILDSIKPGEKDEFRWCVDPTGFGVRVSPNGKISFVVQGRIQSGIGAPARITIGPYGVFTVDQAREIAREHLRTMRQGRDPRAVKRQDEAQRVTLRQVADAFFARPGMLKDATRDEMDRHLKTSLAAWQDRAIASITALEVRKRYELIAKTGSTGKGPAPFSAVSAFKVLRTLMNWAATQYQTQDGEPLITRNPVAVIAKELAQQGSKVRTRHIDRRQIGTFWNALTTARENPQFSADTRSALDLLKFLVLTGCRRNEGAMLEWRNVHLEDEPSECWWHIEDPKNKNPISLPLSSQAVAVLRARKAANDCVAVPSKFVFPSRSASGHIKDTRAPLERFAATIGMDRLSAHDLRRTFVTLGVKACRLDIAKLELLTNHVPQSVTTRHYLETSDMRDYYPEVQAIADFIESEALLAAAKAAGANVVPLARRA